MKIPENVIFLFPKEPDQQLEADARNLAHEISDSYWPTSFEWNEHGIVMLYQTRHAYLEVMLRHDKSIHFEGRNTAETLVVSGTSALSQNTSFLGTWLDNATDL